MEFFTNSAEETVNIGRMLGAMLLPNTVICFSGDLAAGKTTFIKGIVEAAGAGAKEEVNSPTFIYLNIYKGNVPIYHFDLHRLENGEDFMAMGFDEYFTAGGVCCIEWIERIQELVPPDSIWVNIEHLAGEGRRITINKRDE